MQRNPRRVAGIYPEMLFLLFGEGGRRDIKPFQGSGDARFYVHQMQRQEPEGKMITERLIQLICILYQHPLTRMLSVV